MLSQELYEIGYDCKCIISILTGLVSPIAMTYQYFGLCVLGISYFAVALPCQEYIEPT